MDFTPPNLSSSVMVSFLSFVVLLGCGGSGERGTTIKKVQSELMPRQNGLGDSRTDASGEDLPSVRAPGARGALALAGLPWVREPLALHARVSSVRRRTVADLDGDHRNPRGDASRVES